MDGTQSSTTAEAYGIDVMATGTKHYSVRPVFEAGPLFCGLTEQISDLIPRTFEDTFPLYAPA